LVRLADAAPNTPAAVKPKLRVNARRFRDRRRLRLSLGGFDRRYVLNVEYKAGKKRLGRSAKSPFRIVVRTRARRVTAFVAMTDGRRFAVTRRAS
jgi:hypothetical protein